MRRKLQATAHGKADLKIKVERPVNSWKELAEKIDNAKRISIVLGRILCCMITPKLNYFKNAWVENPSYETACANELHTLQYQFGIFYFSTVIFNIFLFVITVPVTMLSSIQF